MAALNPRTLRLLRCPLCLGALTAEVDLRCRECGRVYPIVGGIPRMVIGSNESQVAKSFGFQWRVRANGWFERDALYGLSAEEERENFFSCLGIDPATLAGKTVLDAGCGDGFLLPILAGYSCTVVGVDINPSIEISASRCARLSNISVLQADILSPPFSQKAFDFVWCEGVLVHTEDPRKAFALLSELVKPGGRLYVWVYPSEQLSIYQRTRDLLKIAHRLPRSLLLALCYALAVPLALTRRLLQQRERRESVRSSAFGFFDNLSPRIQTRHTVAEVRAWFEEFGFTNLKQTGMIGMSGTKVS